LPSGASPSNSCALPLPSCCMFAEGPTEDICSCVPVTGEDCSTQIAAVQATAVATCPP
jgi:hypothetical protein